MEHAHRYEEDPEHAHPPSTTCSVCVEMEVEEDTRENELTAALIMAQKLKGLQTVGWSSFFGRGEGELEGMAKGDSVNAGANEHVEWGGIKGITTKIWILRAKGRVRVRRVSW
jgi:hypothetical protein